MHVPHPELGRRRRWLSDGAPSVPRTGLTLPLAAIAALGAVLVLARQVPFGVGLHWDSGNYVAVARYLLAGEGFREYSGAVYVSWPPLYPLVLAVASLDVLDPLAVAGPVNAALFALTIFVVGRYLQRRLESRFLVVWAALAIALATPLAGQAAIAMSGTAFILLVTLTLIHVDAFLAKGRTSSLVWTGTCAALAWQTRYLGAALVAAVAVMLLLQRGARPPQRVRRAAGFALLAGAPMVVWLVRNRLVSGTFTGPRGYGRRSWVALSGIGEELWSWATFDPPLVEWPAVGIAGFLPAVALAAACGVLVRERWRGRTRPSPSGWLPCYVFGGFALTFFTALVASLALAATFGGFEERHLTPLYVPIAVTAAFALDRVLGFAPRRSRFRRRWKLRWGRRGPQAAAAGVTAVLCFWTAGQIEPNAREIRQRNSEGYDFASRYWAGSETLEWIRRNPLEGIVLSNVALLVSIHNYALELGPGQGYSHLHDKAEHMENFLRVAGDRDKSYYVVLIGTDNEWLTRNLEYGVADLRASSGLEPIVELADGAVFRVRRSEETETADQ